MSSNPPKVARRHVNTGIKNLCLSVWENLADAQGVNAIRVSKYHKRLRVGKWKIHEWAEERVSHFLATT